MQHVTAMQVIDWTRKFKYVLFDEDITNQDQLFTKLVEFAKLTPDAHERWLNRFNDRTDLFRYMSIILPTIREEFKTTLSLKELKIQHLKLQESIEKLKAVLEEKLNGLL